jgi:hypothetical protein
MTKDEKIIALINWKRSEEAEAARQTAIIQTMRTGCLEIEGVALRFAEQTILDGQLRVKLPDNFIVMSPETARLKYPLDTRPGLIFTGPDGTVNITFNHSGAALTNAEVADFTDKMIRMIEKMQPDVRWQEHDVKDVSGKKVGFCDFVAPAVDDDIYNLIFFMELNGRVLIGALNCPVALMHNWKPIGLGIMDSLRTNSDVAGALLQNQVKDFADYPFKPAGFYAQYNNKEYRLFKLGEGNYRLVSFDPVELANGFEKKDGVYRKTVTGAEINVMYEIKTRVVYQGEQFELGQVGKSQVQLLKKDCDIDLAQRLEMDRTGYREYEKWVAKERIEDVREDKVTV